MVFIAVALTTGGTVALTTPKPYRAALDLLRTAAADARWPATSPSRARQLIEGRTIILANPAALTSKRRGPLANRLFPELATALFELERVIAPTAHAHSVAPATPRPPSASVAVNVDASFAPHFDLGHGAGPEASSLVVSLGDHTGGALAVQGGTELELLHRPVCIDGWRVLHWTRPWEGERFSLCFFTCFLCSLRKLQWKSFRVYQIRIGIFHEPQLFFYDRPQLS